MLVSRRKLHRKQEEKDGPKEATSQRFAALCLNAMLRVLPRLWEALVGGLPRQAYHHDLGWSL
jgi:hypothetical protein